MGIIKSFTLSGAVGENAAVSQPFGGIDLFPVGSYQYEGHTAHVQIVRKGGTGEFQIELQARVVGADLQGLPFAPVADGGIYTEPILYKEAMGYTIQYRFVLTKTAVGQSYDVAIGV